MQIKRGVDYYTIGRGEIRGPFPNDIVECKRCIYFGNDRCGRPQCRITEQLIYQPSGYIDNYCPFTTFEKSKEGLYVYSHVPRSEVG